MSRKLEKTKGTVRGLGLKRVFWLFFDVYEAVLVRPGEKNEQRGFGKYHCDETEVTLFLELCFND